MSHLAGDGNASIAPLLLGQEGSSWKFAVDISGWDHNINHIKNAGESLQRIFSVTCSCRLLA